MKIAALATAVVALSLASLRAELPPSAYEDMKKEAGELLEVDVTKVTLTPDKDGERVVAEATVRKVTRSEEGLKPGNPITISYVHRDMKGMVGPSPIPVIMPGKRITVWLNEDENGTGTSNYGPAAGSQSFEPVDDEPDADTADAPPAS